MEGRGNHWIRIKRQQVDPNTSAQWPQVVKPIKTEGAIISWSQMRILCPRKFSSNHQSFRVDPSSLIANIPVSEAHSTMRVVLLMSSLAPAGWNAYPSTSRFFPYAILYSDAFYKQNSQSFNHCCNIKETRGTEYQSRLNAFEDTARRPNVYFTVQLPLHFSSPYEKAMRTIYKYNSSSNSAVRYSNVSLESRLSRTAFNNISTRHDGNVVSWKFN